MLTWGASDFVDDSGKGNGKFELSLQFPNDPEDKNEETESLLKNLVELENKIKGDALKFSKDWFGKIHKSSDVVDALWTPMLKYSRDKNTGEANMAKAPVLRVKLPQWEGIWKSEIYDEDGCKLFPDTSNPTVSPLDFIKKGTQVATIIQCGGLWFANGKFGITWKLVQAVVQKPRANIVGQCFIKLKKSDKDKLKSQPQIEEEPDVVSSTIVDDSDEEDEQVSSQALDPEPLSEPEPVVVAPVVVAPEPVTVVKKKVAPKKKTDA